MPFFTARAKNSEVVINMDFIPEGRELKLSVYQAYEFLEELVNATSLAIQNKIKEN